MTTTTDPRDLEIHVSPRSGQIIARPIDAEKRPMAGAFATCLRRREIGFSWIRSGACIRSATECTISDTFVPDISCRALKFTDLLQLSQNPARFAALRELGRSLPLQRDNG